MNNQEHLNADTPAARATAAAEFRRDKKTGKALLGMPIISLTNGEKIGEVHSVVYSAREGRLLYVTIPHGGGLFGGGNTLKLRVEDFHSLGEDAITVQDGSKLIELDRNVKDVESEAGEDILGKRLMTDDGSFLGTIDDVLIDRHSRKLVAYEISGGLWRDITRGQSDIPIDFVGTIGKDVVIVPAHVKEQALIDNGGLSGVLSSAQEKIDDGRTRASLAIEDKEADYAVGRVAADDVSTEDGTVIVRKGETITEEHVQHAMLTERMHALAIVAGKGQAGDLVDAAKAKAADLGEAAQNKQAEMLVGKTTGRDVFADDANTVVMIPAGTLLETHHVEAARTAGKLGAVTTAVGANAFDTAKEKAAGAYDSAKERVGDAKDSYDERREAAEAQRTLDEALNPSPALSGGQPTVVINNPQNVTVTDSEVLEPSTNPGVTLR